MTVLTTLDCGCAILNTGRRVLCPSCADPAPRPLPPESAANHLRNSLQMLDGLVAVEHRYIVPTELEPIRRRVSSALDLLNAAGLR